MYHSCLDLWVVGSLEKFVFIPEFAGYGKHGGICAYAQI